LKRKGKEMNQIQDLLSDLEELLDERDEKHDLLDAESEAGNAHEADGHAEDLAEINVSINEIKANLERQIRSL
jgi:t-SNARE complex subunit (syntaxin)